MTDLLDNRIYAPQPRLPEFLHDVAGTIKRVHPDSTIILFGSYARGEQHEDSDLDICVLVPELTKRRIDMKVDIRGIICDICYDNNLGFDLKLYTYNEFEQESRFRSTLQHTIKEEGVTLNG
jgi:predicted nucleotidyltransferase